jgi:hypothetical protein
MLVAETADAAFADPSLWLRAARDARRPFVKIPASLIKIASPSSHLHSIVLPFRR